MFISFFALRLELCAVSLFYDPCACSLILVSFPPEPWSSDPPNLEFYISINSFTPASNPSSRALMSRCSVEICSRGG